MLKKRPSFLLILTCLLTFFIATSIVLAYPEYDLGGQTIGISMFQNFWGITPLGERGEYDWYNPDPRLQAHIEQVEEMFNVNIEFTPRSPEGRVSELITTQILTGQTETHYFQETYAYAPILVSQGLIQPLDDYLTDEYFARLPESFRRAFKVSGKYYAIEPLNFNTEPLGIVWNKDIFEQYDMPDLYELYEDGLWTWDAMEEIATNLTMDTTGDGNIDLIGLQFHNPPALTLTNFMATNGGSLTKFEDGRYAVAFTDPEIVDVLTFVQRMFEKGVATAAPFGGRPWRWGMCVITPHHIPMAEMAEIGTNMGYVPLPKGPNADHHVAPRTNAWTGVIPISVENPGAVIEIVHALWQLSEPYINDINVWEQDYWAKHSRHLSDRQSLKNWQWGERNAFHLDNRALIMDAGFANAVTEIVLNQAPVLTTLAQVVPIAQGVLDDIYGQ